MSLTSFRLVLIVIGLVLTVLGAVRGEQLELSPGQVVAVQSPAKILVGRRAVEVLPSGSLAVVVSTGPDKIDTYVVKDGTLVRGQLARGAVKRLSANEYVNAQLAELLHDASTRQKEVVLTAVDRIDPNQHCSDALKKALFDVIASSGSVSARRKALSILARHLRPQDLSETERKAVLSVPLDAKTIATSLDVLTLVPNNKQAQQQVMRAFAKSKQISENLSLLSDRFRQLDKGDCNLLAAFLWYTWQQKWSRTKKADAVSKSLLHHTNLLKKSDNCEGSLARTWMDRIQSSNNDVRYGALLQLRSIGVFPGTAAKLLPGGRAWRSPPNLETLLRAQTILSIEPENKEAILHIIKAAEGNSAVQRQCAREILLGKAPWLSGVRSVIERFLKSTDMELRTLGCDLLRRCSLGCNTTVELAKLALDDSAASVRRSAVLSLRLCSNHKNVGPLLSARFKDSDASVRRAALDVVPQKPLSEHPALECLNDRNPTVRAAAVRVLGRVTDDSVVEAVSRAIHDKCPDVREAAALAIREQVQRGRSAAQFNSLVAPLVALLDDPSSGVRKAAVSALSMVDSDNLNTANKIFVSLTDENKQWDLPYLPTGMPDQTALQRHGVILTPAVCTLLLDNLDRLPAEKAAKRLAIIAACKDGTSKMIAQSGFPQYLTLLKHRDGVVRDMAADTIRHVSRIAEYCAWGTPPPEIWPPPLWTSRAQLKRLLLPKPQDTYGDLFDGLVEVLGNKGYYDRSIFVMEPGFVVLTRLERIDSSGVPDMQHRWLQGKVSLESFSLWEWLQRIFVEPPGDYRLFIFFVSPQEIVHSGNPLLVKNANELLTRGQLDLPSDVRQQPCDSNVPCEALIYHFKKKPGDEPSLLSSEDSGIQGIEYLQRAGLVSP